MSKQGGIIHVLPQKEECKAGPDSKDTMPKPGKADAETPGHKLTRREGRMRGRLHGQEKFRTGAGQGGEGM
jgi:hypothetical protein